MGGGRVYGRAPVALNQSDRFTASPASLRLEVVKNVAEADGEFGACGAERGRPNWDGTSETWHQSQRFHLLTARRKAGKQSTQPQALRLATFS